MKKDQTPDQKPEAAPHTEKTVHNEQSARTLPAPETVNAIIRNRVHSSLAIALVPVPAFDMAALAALQLEMIYKLAKAYDIPFQAQWGKQITIALVGGILPSLLTPKLSDLARYIPIIGPGLGLATLPLANAAATYAVGKSFADHFATGQGLDKASMNKISDSIKAGYETSKKTVSGWIGKGKAPTETTVETPAS
ncbi:YcjF family protein [Desulfoplanes formicivorans]|uniref:GTPase domain-containing protein n=1 Tax=Desulfoplanes formicivorans TaxID=1592317 RepID=A0A194AH23_9BACT|nr:DUF697 domain-containing protein [Desulfoplanes formicivorans]GAU08628.1 GTPase domain-containing protein [Desulfoplanes formicivorans]